MQSVAVAIVVVITADAAFYQYYFLSFANSDVVILVLQRSCQARGVPSYWYFLCACVRIYVCMGLTLISTL